MHRKENELLHIRKTSVPNDVQEKSIEIKKTAEWKKVFSSDSNAIRSYFDLLDKEKIREGLRKEQHGLCAYCMGKLSVDSEGRDDFTIEHFTPISPEELQEGNGVQPANKELALDYHNMLGCCSGGRKSEVDDRRILCCDAAKGNKIIIVDPRNKSFVDRIWYSKDGLLRVKDATDKELFDINYVLNLNGWTDKSGQMITDTASQLVGNRASAYRAYQRFMNKLDKECNGNDERIVERIKKKIKELEGDDEYQEYLGVTLYFLKRRARLR